MKVNNDLIGSNLTRTMLERGDKQIWCAIDNDSDKQAMTEYEGYRFTAYITFLLTENFIRQVVCHGHMLCQFSWVN